LSGAIEFDGDGNLFVATGDNTMPFLCDGYSPLDERPGREAFDAQRTAANSASLMGKILRIRPLAEGAETSPP
jgi:glucose/arabinose dehydrogenase